MDEEERMRERNRIRAKKHRRVRKIEEEYSGDESNCELCIILMLLRTPLKNSQKRAGYPGRFPTSLHVGNITKPA